MVNELENTQPSTTMVWTLPEQVGWTTRKTSLRIYDVEEQNNNYSLKGFNNESVKYNYMYS